MPRADSLAVCALLSCLILLCGCHHKKRRAPLEPSAGVSSMIQVADPRASAQLGPGFHQVEGGSWRWTARQFSATLHPPKDAARKGATLVLKFAIHETVIQKLKTIQLSASVSGIALPPETYAKPGDYTYSRDVPGSALQSDAVRVDFSLNQALPPNPPDVRELGIIARAIGLEAK